MMKIHHSIAINTLLSLVLILFLATLGGSYTSDDHDQDLEAKKLSLGVIVDYGSRAGREEKIAMEVAIDDFCATHSYRYCPTLHANDSRGDPILTVFLAKTQIETYKARAILGLEAWHDAYMTVPELGNKSQVPVLSLANEIPIWATKHLPFLVSAARSQHAQMKAVAAIIHSWPQWRKVNVIYEDVDLALTGIIPYLLEAIHEAGSEISTLLPLPPLYTQSNAYNLTKPLETLKRMECRVFIVHTSIPLATKIFAKAKSLGIMEDGSVWITTTTITNHFDSLTSSSISSSMQGIVGVKSYFSQSGNDFKRFCSKFSVKYHSQFPKEKYLVPGLYALQAYDAAWAVALAALEGKVYDHKEIITNKSKLSTNNFYHSVRISGKELLKSILQSNFAGLAGPFKFTKGMLSPAEIFEVVNVVGRSYRDLGYWSTGLGFSKSIQKGSSYSVSMRDLGQVFWPGGPWSVPRGWEVPTSSNPLKIGIPANSTFTEYVSVTYDPKGNRSFGGFSIEVLKMIIDKLPYHLSYDFVPFEGHYDSLVQQVQLQKFDAVVADTAIIASRCNYAEFSQPYADSGLQMLVYYKPRRLERAWLFTKPFTLSMWVATFFATIFSGFVIWCLEWDAHPEFREGNQWNKLGIILALAFTTLLSQQGPQLTRNLARLAFVVWLFVAIIIAQSYTASLTTLLTVDQLAPTTVDIDTLKKTGAKVGCDGNSFVVKYLEDVLGFNPHNIRKIYSEDEYPQALISGEIAAAFLEVPYVKLFVAKYCNYFITSGPTIKVGGFGFAFSKCSPLLPDISQAIVELTENGTLLKLEKAMLSSYSCSDSSSAADDHKSLGVGSFSGLFLINGGTSAFALIVFFILHFAQRFRPQQLVNPANNVPETDQLEANPAHVEPNDHEDQQELHHHQQQQQHNPD